MQDTPSRGPLLGLGTIDHLTPFRDSIRVRSKLSLPTAVQDLEEIHDTPLRKLALAGMWGLAKIDQLVPSQDSIRVRVSRLLSYIYAPTAVQELDEMQATASR